VHARMMLARKKIRVPAGHGPASDASIISRYGYPRFRYLLPCACKGKRPHEILTTSVTPDSRKFRVAVREGQQRIYRANIGTLRFGIGGLLVDIQV